MTFSFDFVKKDEGMTSCQDADVEQFKARLKFAQGQIRVLETQLQTRSKATKDKLNALEAKACAWNAGDKCSGGAISKRDLSAMFKGMNWNTEDLDLIMSVIDASQDAVLTYDDIVEWIMTGRITQCESKSVDVDFVVKDPGSAHHAFRDALKACGIEDLKYLPVQQDDVKTVRVTNKVGREVDPNREPHQTNFPLRVQMVVEVQPVEANLMDLDFVLLPGQTPELIFQESMSKLGFDGKQFARLQAGDVKTVRTVNRVGIEVNPNVRPEPENFPLKVQMVVLAKKLGLKKLVPLDFRIEKPKYATDAITEALRQSGIVFEAEALQPEHVMDVKTASINGPELDAKSTPMTDKFPINVKMTLGLAANGVYVPP